MHATADHVLPRLRLFRIQAPVWSLGPGRRIGLWIQGCSRRCAGCISPESWPEDGGRAVDVRELAEAIAAEHHAYQGLTISGGEPFDQYPSLMALCAYLKALCGLHIQVYTGYTLAELRDRHPDRAFLTCLDAIVDGPFLGDQQDGSGWRGSRNQRRYRVVAGRAELEEDEAVTTPGPWTLTVTAGGQLFMAGIPGDGQLAALGRDLAARGVRTRFA